MAHRARVAHLKQNQGRDPGGRDSRRSRAGALPSKRVEKRDQVLLLLVRQVHEESLIVEISIRRNDRGPISPSRAGLAEKAKEPRLSSARGFSGIDLRRAAAQCRRRPDSCRQMLPPTAISPAVAEFCDSISELSGAQFQTDTGSKLTLSARSSRTQSHGLLTGGRGISPPAALEESRSTGDSPFGAVQVGFLLPASCS
jgi:hypothetical protein